MAFGVKFTVQKFDESEINKVISDIQTKIENKPIKIKIDTAYIQQQIDKSLSSIKFDKVQQSISTEASTSFSKGISGGMKQLQSATANYSKVFSQIFNGQDKFGKIDTSGLKSAYAELNKCKIGTEEFTQAEINFSGALKKVQTQIYNMGKVTSVNSSSSNMLTTQQKQIDSIVAKYKAIQSTINVNKNSPYNYNNVDTSKLESAYAALKNCKVGTEQFTQAYNALDSEVKKVNSDISDISKTNTATRQANKEAQELKNTYTQILRELRQNPKLANSGIGQRMRDLADGIQSGATNSSDAKMKLAALNAESENLGLTAQTLGEKLSNLFREHFDTAIAMAGIHLLQTAMTQLMQNVKDLDSALVNIRIITGQNNAQAQELLSTYNSMAKNLGATTTQVAESATEWLRQGYTLEDTNTLIKNSMVLSKDGMINSADATSYLTSAMKGYNISAKDSISIADKLTSVDMAAAVSAGGIAEGMSRTASSAQLAGISMDKLIGYLTVTGEVTQKSMDSIGESYKTLFARMGNIKSGRLVDPETSEDLSDVESTLKGLGIKLRDSDSEFRNFGSVLDEVGGKWNSFSSVQQHAIAVAFAGTRNQENFLVLMQNYQKALGYTEIAANSSGTAMEKFNVYTQGIEAKTNAFKASLEGLSTTLVDSSIVKGVIDLGTAFVSAFDGATKFAGVIPVIVTALSGYLTATGTKAGEFNTPSISGMAGVDATLVFFIKYPNCLERAKSLATTIAQ